MPIKSTIARPIAAYIVRKQRREQQKAVHLQWQLLQKLLRQAAHTHFGQAHRFTQIRNYSDFQQAVPLADYEQLRPYIDRIIAGEQHVLWRGQPLYFAKTSGTTSGIKYIPVTKDSIGNLINGARNALLWHIHESRNADFVAGKMLFLSGSPELGQKGSIATGRLSGIVHHHVPTYLHRNRLPTYPTNCLADFEEKIARIVSETKTQDMRLIGGIPPWVQLYFDQLQQQTSKTIGELFPNLSVLVHGGVNFRPYRAKMQHSIGKKVAMIETYPASEGFIAYQNSQHEEGLLLNVNDGIFYEFVPADQIFMPNPPRFSLENIELGINYAIILNTNAGLWGYIIGDTVKFISKKPYKLLVTGRIKHFISAFGEHVIGEEVEKALFSVAQAQSVRITEFTVAPKIAVDSGLPHHEWFIEFDTEPQDLTQFAQAVDQALQQQNSYYADLIEGKVLQTLSITPLQKGAFQQYMKALGKQDAQNKVPRLANNREIVERLEIFGLLDV